MRDGDGTRQGALASVHVRSITHLPITEGRRPLARHGQRGSEYKERTVSEATVFQHTGGNVFRVSHPLGNDLAVRRVYRNVVEKPLSGDESGMQVD